MKKYMLNEEQIHLSWGILTFMLAMQFLVLFLA
jgi:hypothetical protein